MVLVGLKQEAILEQKLSFNLEIMNLTMFGSDFKVQRLRSILTTHTVMLTEFYQAGVQTNDQQTAEHFSF